MERDKALHMEVLKGQKLNTIPYVLYLRFPTKFNHVAALTNATQKELSSPNNN